MDTCTVCESIRPKPNPKVLEFLQATHESQLCISVITIGEILNGASLLPDGQRRRNLEQWLATLESEYANRTLPVERETARLWGQMAADCQQKGIALSVPDGLIAATAKQHALELVTLNLRDFQRTGVKVYPLL